MDFPVAFTLLTLLPLWGLGQTPATSMSDPLPGGFGQAHHVNPSTGWVLLGQKLLFSNTVGRTFTDITPQLANQQTIMGVTFYDGLSGWVVIEGPPIQPDAGSPMKIGATNNGGKSWIYRPIAPNDDVLLGNHSEKVSLSFVSPERGFALFQLMSNTASSGGFLFATDDADKTWKKIAATSYGTMQFVSPNTGWIVRGVGDRHVFRTSNGGLAWKELAVPLPPDIKAEDGTYFAGPTPFYRVFYQIRSFPTLYRER